jgi:hypothetical protein
MKHIIFLLTTTLLAASTSHADEGLRVRYRDVSAQMSLTVSHDIGVSENPSFASRDFSFGLALTADRPAEAVTVTIDQAKATYVAHGMSQRLGTRHLTGQSFQLSIADDGRQLESVRPSDAPSIDLGPIPSSGFSVAALLADTLPVLPEQTVAIGATWTTERPIRSLEGWAWASGQLVSRHRVTAVDDQDSHTVVTVATEAEASLGPVEGERAYSGALKRTLLWTFDATEGRLLSMSLEQEADGVSDLPQGEFSIHQLTQVELAPAS